MNKKEYKDLLGETFIAETYIYKRIYIKKQ